MTVGGVVFLLVVAGLVFLIISGYNKLVGLRQRSDEAWSDIDVQLKRRTDLVPNLVETVKGYAADRKSTRLNSSHSQISYAVFCLKKKNTGGYSVEIAIPWSNLGITPSADM